MLSKRVKVTASHVCILIFAIFDFLISFYVARIQHQSVNHIILAYDCVFLNGYATISLSLAGQHIKWQDSHQAVVAFPAACAFLETASTVALPRADPGCAGRAVRESFSIFPR